MKTLLHIIFLISFLGCIAEAQPLAATAAVSGRTAYLGESFDFQIQITGSESPDTPNLDSLTDFNVEFTGQGSNSSQSVSFVNGRMTQNKRLGYIFNYSLRALKAGQLIIPQIDIQADGQTIRTQAIAMNIKEPTEAEDFKLRMALSKDRAYVGERLELQATFYFRANTVDNEITIPLMDRPEFEVYDLPDGPLQKRILKGREYQTVTVRKLVTVKTAGQYTLSPALLSFRGEDGYKISQDFFGRKVRSPRYKNFVIPSNDLSLEVLPVPTQGKPANYNGLIGTYSVKTSATPTQVNVGDPITLTITLKGDAVGLVKLPPLDKQDSLIKDFKVPSDIEDGEISGTSKVFTQTIRTTHADVSAIPPIEIPYFDTSTGQYKVAKSAPIPIQVQATRVVTIDDAEGVSAAPINTSQEVQSANQGILHNYTNDDILLSQPLPPKTLFTAGRLSLLVGLPLCYVVALFLKSSQTQGRKDSSHTKAKRALNTFKSQLAKSQTSDEIILVFKTFLGHKFKVTPEALTYRDIAPRLTQYTVPSSLEQSVKQLLALGEANRFSGSSAETNTEELREQTLTLAQNLEPYLKWPLSYPPLSPSSGWSVAYMQTYLLVKPKP